MTSGMVSALVKGYYGTEVNDLQAACARHHLAWSLTEEDFKKLVTRVGVNLETALIWRDRYQDSPQYKRDVSLIENGVVEYST